MTDVKELCDVMLDVPAPPLRTSAEALALAKRSTRRRDAVAVGACGLAVLTIVALVATSTAIMGPGVGGNLSVVGAKADPPTPAAPPPLVPAPGVPSADAATAHGPQVFAILTAAVPAGYTSRPEYSDPTTTWLVDSPSSDHYSTSTSAVVSADGREGLLEAFVMRDDQPAPTADLCSAEVATRLDHTYGTAGAACEAFVIDGVPIRVTTQQDPERGEVTIAIRLLDGGTLAVISQQGRVTYSSDADLPPNASHTTGRDADHKPPLTTSMLSAQQVATIAANPAILP